jgi:hypothetical protein
MMIVPSAAPEPGSVGSPSSRAVIFENSIHTCRHAEAVFPDLSVTYRDNPEESPGVFATLAFHR